jgi:predicted  nucleic acid-binding Zn-ribbon protein
MAAFSEEEFIALLDISEIDKRLTQLRFRKENLAEANALQEITVRARDLQIQGVELQAELVELKDLVTKAEIDVEQVVSRMKKNQDLLDFLDIFVCYYRKETIQIYY